MNILQNLISGNKPQTINPCQVCQSKLCCVVYSILPARDGTNYRAHDKQKIIPIKPAGKACEHLSLKDGCKIYDTRSEHDGYGNVCSGYSCYGAGPMVDTWIRTHQIPVTTTNLGEVLNAGSRSMFRGESEKFFHLLARSSTVDEALEQIDEDSRGKNGPISWPKEWFRKFSR